MTYQDHDGNAVHHFDIPTRHSRLTLTAEALVECDRAEAAARSGSGPARGRELDALAPSGECWEHAGPEHVRHARRRCSTPSRRSIASSAATIRSSLLRRLMRRHE